MNPSSLTTPKSFGAKLVTGLGGLIMLAVIMSYLKVILLPMVLAFFVTLILNPLAIKFQAWGLPRPLAVIATLLFGLASVWVTANFIFSSLVVFRDGLPAYQGRLSAMYEQMVALKEIRFRFLTFELVKSHLSSFSLGGVFGSIFNNFFSLTGNMLLTAVFILYFLPGLPALPGKLKRAFPGTRGLELCRAVEEVTDQVQRYVLFKTFASAAVGLLVGVSCWLFGVDFAPTWGIFAFFLNFLPTLGAIAASLGPFLFCAIQRGWGVAFWLLATLFVIMISFGNFLEPRVLGKSVNISPTVAFLSILAWGWLWGGIGMIVAVPATAVIKMACDRLPSLAPLGDLMGN